MRSSQDYRAKADAAERLANHPRQPAELRSELQAVARQWRHRAELTDWLDRVAGADEPSRRRAAWWWGGSANAQQGRLTLAHLFASLVMLATGFN